jgi:hypothetical protein
MYTEKREEAGYVEEIRRRALKISQKCGWLSDSISWQLLLSIVKILWEGGNQWRRKLNQWKYNLNDSHYFTVASTVSWKLKTMSAKVIRKKYCVWLQCNESVKSIEREEKENMVIFWRIMRNDVSVQCI